MAGGWLKGKLLDGRKLWWMDFWSFSVGELEKEASAVKFKRFSVERAVFEANVA
jgi:hypothetical protein